MLNDGDEPLVASLRNIAAKDLGIPGTILDGGRGEENFCIDVVHPYEQIQPSRRST
jgi:hypothetical protein